MNENLTPLPKGSHLNFRKCRNCGSLNMGPATTYQSTGLDSGTDHGQNYKCPNCETQIQIKDTGALFMGAIYSIFWGAVAYWAFLKGPFWYAKHASIILDNSYGLGFMFADAIILLVSISAMTFSFWIIWTFFVGPVITLLRHPVTYENRPQSIGESDVEKLRRRNALLSFLVLPLGFWAPLLAIIWLLDRLGIDVRDGSIKYIAIFGLLGLISYFTKIIGANAIYAFVGMAFWLMVFVGLIFLV